MLDPVLTRLGRWVEGLLGWMLAAMVILVFGNVVLRYGFNSGIMVSEEVSRLIFVWMIFIGAAVAVREQSHLGIDALVRRLPHIGRIICVVLCDLLILFALGLLFLGSWKQMVINASTSSPVAQISMAYMYLPGVIASVAMAILVLIHLYRVLAGKVSDTDLMLGASAEAVVDLEHST
ncbi:MAG TPA: TRAP transporter small permease [Burkholderiaceae bacterium]|nr:TRAP transporter small permease [Burkholderiaceae bacterium]